MHMNPSNALPQSNAPRSIWSRAIPHGPIAPIINDCYDTVGLHSTEWQYRVVAVPSSSSSSRQNVS